jgi:hypothetical protein
MSVTLKCKKCGFDGDFSSQGTDRFCRKCGTPFFLPLDEIKPTENVDEGWDSVYNSLYNYDDLIPSHIQYAIKRFCNWRYGIMSAGRMLRQGSTQGDESLKKLNKLIVFHISFMRSGYALRVMEEKLTGKLTPSVSSDEIQVMEREGIAALSKEVDFLDSSWNIHEAEETEANKQFAMKLLGAAIAISNGDLDRFLLLSKKQVESIFGSIVDDSARWFNSEGFFKGQESTNEIISDVIFGHSVRVAEKLFEK